jgi:DNA repair protein RecO (recombination protein O)
MTLFTLEKGKVRAIAKGVRKAKSRMSGSLDVFAHGQMMLAEGRNLDVITQFQRITDTGPLSGDLARSAAGAVMVEVADKVLEERHPQPELFSLLVAGLSRLADTAVSPRVETTDFLVRVLGELGYAPELRVCARCGRELPGAGLAFSAIAGGVIGPECDQGSPAISARAVKILRVLASGDRELFGRLQLEEADLRAIEAALEAQLEHHLDRQLKSIDFARRIRR